ncbi:Hsp33 family molecular chaperone [Thermopetrobacter sp. TC1]|uniref:Hsp33 family molecular chaperone n=1 Tax=Thermopetrobacter sp. TC1 TaxID=1495045 RepID=UPI000571C50C|nr:Hsp33 family molecular chaperone [Thermopetrobacter sp. TC1]
MNDAQDGTVRPARAEMGDNLVLPFTVDALDVRGRVVRMGESVNEAIVRHALPEPLARLLGEIMALAALIGSSLKFEGKLIVQAETDGPVRLLVADFSTPRFVRGLVRYDKARVDEVLAQGGDERALLGEGRMVFTIDQGAHMQRYQGMVALTGTLAEAAETYFSQSEQIPTRVKLAAGTVQNDGGPQWRAGAIMIQHMPPASGESSEEDAAAKREQNAENWRRAEALFDTVEAHELLDPSLSPERLLYRLFHEDGVRVFEPQPLEWRCGCSRELLHGLISRFSPEERAEMVEDGRISARCEFCGEEYVFSPEEFEGGDEGGEKA